MQAFWSFVQHDWYFAIPMFGMSFAAATLVVWRLLLNVNARTNMSVFLPEFQEKLKKEGVDCALAFCRAQKGIIPRKLFAAGLETGRQGTDRKSTRLNSSHVSGSRMPSSGLT